MNKAHKTHKKRTKKLRRKDGKKKRKEKEKDLKRKNKVNMRNITMKGTIKTIIIIIQLQFIITLLNNLCYLKLIRQLS